jgi:hypothetical protein
MFPLPMLSPPVHFICKNYMRNKPQTGTVLEFAPSDKRSDQQGSFFHNHHLLDLDLAEKSSPALTLTPNHLIC